VAILSYKLTGRTSSPTTFEGVLTESIDTTTAIAQALQSESNYLASVVDSATLYNIHLPTALTTMQTNIRSYLSTTNSNLSALLAEKKALDTLKQTIRTNEQNLELLKIGDSSGNNPISLQISQNSLVKQERNLQDLKDALNDHTVVAPFSGTLSAVPTKVGDTSGTIATIITNQQVAELSLNEVDASKINLRQKATLTFDAISDLSITGTVAEIDPVGTVSQGVVSYTVKISFDTQDARIKPGMTVNASVQSAVHSDVLIVPSSAVKTIRGVSYVQIFNPPLTDSEGSAGVTSLTPPEQVEVVTGISNDTSIEIVSGISEGEQVVSKTITTTTKTVASPSATSLLGGGGTRIGGAGR
jgi:HlyD family secretion protein